MPFLIVEYSRVYLMRRLKSVGGATFCFLLGLVTYYLSLDMQSSCTVN